MYLSIKVSPDIPISVSDPAIHQNSPIAKQITVRPRGEDKRGVQDVEKGVQDGSEGGHGAALETDLLLERIAAIQQVRTKLTNQSTNQSILMLELRPSWLHQVLTESSSL